MGQNLDKMSEEELQTVISDAEKLLKQKQSEKKKEVLAEIQRLAASINVKVEISSGESRKSLKGSKVPPKYRNPDDASQQWTGRGVKPKWLQEKLAGGKKLEDFLI